MNLPSKRDLAIVTLGVLGVSLAGMAHLARYMWGWIGEPTHFAAMGLGALLMVPCCWVVTDSRVARWVLAAILLGMAITGFVSAISN